MSFQHSDLLSTQLRNIESEIDNAYRANPLTKLDFSKAGWTLLAFGEDSFLKPHVIGDDNTVHTASIIPDNFITSVNYPLYWLYKTCSNGGEPPFRCDNGNYQAAWDLLNLGKNYTTFCSVFTYASRGIIQLTVEGSRLIPVHDFLVQSQYEAYNRLIKPSFTDEPISESEELVELISLSLRIDGERFSYKLSPQVAKAAKRIIGPGLRKRFVLPDTWQFSRYSLEDFRRVFETLTAISLTHWWARYLAARSGCSALGYADSIFVPGRDELLGRTVNYSGVEERIVSYVLHDLTYGSTPGPMPDPALQPLIPLNSELYAVMPNLWLHNAAERNFTVLLNRLPAERAIYSRLVADKESLMKQNIETSLSQQNLRFVNGGIPGDSDLPDIDLAVIDDAGKVCILFELKWFIEPAEIREVIEKTEELKKGVRQLIALKRAFEDNHHPLLGKLRIDATYALYLVLASENWIGHSNAQHPEVSIIKTAHIIGKLEASRDLRETGEWLQHREYLPINTAQYEVIETKSTINNWTINWYGIKPLVTNEFFPL
jgi:hypothetical protein